MLIIFIVQALELLALPFHLPPSPLQHRWLSRVDCKQTTVSKALKIGFDSQSLTKVLQSVPPKTSSNYCY